jgi:16S rRNA (cytosine967-C5)-methyltransferase
LREFDATRELLAGLKTSQPHLGYSHPEWLVARWQERWGTDQTARLLEWNNTPPLTCARVNSLKIDSERLLERWRRENIACRSLRRDWFENNLVFELKSHPALPEMPSFKQGCFYVQDPSTLLAVRELNPQPGECILDLCAAPGGKTTYIAQFIKNKGVVVASDIAPERVKLIAENCERLGVTCVKAVPTSTLDPGASTFDRVLVDVPCSNTGVMRRRVDLRWRIQLEEIARLRTVQRQLLDQAAAVLKRGGTLVYSTCSLEPEENHNLVAEFLQEHPEYKLLLERELVPFNDGVDGAFVARLGRGA